MAIPYATNPYPHEVPADDYNGPFSDLNGPFVRLNALMGGLPSESRLETLLQPIEKRFLTKTQRFAIAK